MTYVFVTYSFEGMRGVQVRGIRIAENLPKNEVVFFNSGDDRWLRQGGYQVRQVSFDKITRIDEIQFPEETRAVIFCDMPTNRPYQTLLFLAAKKQGIPVVVIENLYHSSQGQQPVYKAIINNTDLWLWNGISSLWDKTEHLVNTQWIPPLMKAPHSSFQEARQAVMTKYNIPAGHKIILASGYQEDVRSIIDQLCATILSGNTKVHFIIIAAAEEYRQDGNVIYTPVLQEKDIRPLLMGSDLLICKKGFLQILEAFSFGVPVVCMGKYEGFYDSWLDPEIRNVLPYHPYYSDKLVTDITRLVIDGPDRDLWLRQVRALHNGLFDGGEKAARMLQQKILLRKEYSKAKLLISLNISSEIKVAQEVIRRQEDLLPVIISVPYLTLKNLFLSSSEGQTFDKYNDFDDLVPSSDILRYGTNLTYHCGPHDMHGWALALPWLDTIHEHIQELCKHAEEILVIGQRSEEYLHELLLPFKEKITLISVR